jgi:hypothetical protein
VVCGLRLHSDRGGPPDHRVRLLHLSHSTASSGLVFYIQPPSTFVFAPKRGKRASRARSLSSSSGSPSWRSPWRQCGRPDRAGSALPRTIAFAQERARGSLARLLGSSGVVMPDRWTEAGRRSRVVNDRRSPMPTDAGNRALVQVGLLREPVAAVGLHDLARRRQLAERGANGASADPGLLRDHRRCFRAGLQRRQNLGLVRATGGASTV